MPAYLAIPADRTVAQFEVRRRQFLDEEGRPLAPLPDFCDDLGLMLSIYRGMHLTRSFDAKCVNLQRTGRLGTFATSLGQEAIPVGVASAMRASDVLVPSYREAGAQIWRGCRMEELLLYWGGDERGHAVADPAVKQDFPISITVGNHALHAAGVAAAMKLKAEDRAAVCLFGDGATSKGDIYEAINVAGVWQLPLVLVIVNNQWAISTPLERQTAASALAQKGIAGGLRVLQVDGHDVIAGRHAADEALDAARRGAGASLIEGVTYRLNDHNTADDSSRYRDLEEVKARWGFCPLKRMRAFLVNRAAWSEEREVAMQAEIASLIDAAVDRYLATAPPLPDRMFAHTYANMPAGLMAQRLEALGRTHE
jgi:2-oxoisovalerate dehydrogenase E1 component alpha subunit